MKPRRWIYGSCSAAGQNDVRHNASAEIGICIVVSPTLLVVGGFLSCGSLSDLKGYTHTHFWYVLEEVGGVVRQIGCLFTRMDTDGLDGYVALPSCDSSSTSLPPLSPAEKILTYSLDPLPQRTALVRSHLRKGFPWVNVCGASYCVHVLLYLRRRQGEGG